MRNLRQFYAYLPTGDLWGFVMEFSEHRIGDQHDRTRITRGRPRRWIISDEGARDADNIIPCGLGLAGSDREREQSNYRNIVTTDGKKGPKNVFRSLLMSDFNNID